MDFLKFVANFRNVLLDSINLIITYLGDGVLLIAILCLIYWCLNKTLAYRLVVSFIISNLIVQTLKVTCRIERPWILDKSVEPVKGALSGATGYSFPSGHTSAATALYGTLAFHIKKLWVKVCLFVVIFLVAFSRMYLGVHSPIDVGAAFGITLIIVILVSYAFDNYSLDSNHFGLALVLLGIACFSVLVVNTFLYTQSYIDLANSKDLFNITGLIFGFLLGSYIERFYISFKENAATIPMQIIKYVVGLILTVAVKVIFSFIFTQLICKASPVTYFIPYFATMLFVMAIYPIIIKKFFTSPYLF